MLGAQSIVDVRERETDRLVTGTVRERRVECLLLFSVSGFFVISLIPQIVLTMVKRWEGISLKTVNKTKGVAASRRSEVTSLENYLSLCHVIVRRLNLLSIGRA